MSVNYVDGPTHVWVGVASSGPQRFAELRDWWCGKPTLGIEDTWTPEHGPFVLMLVDLVNLAQLNYDEGHDAGDQLIAMLYEKLVTHAGPARIYLASSQYWLVWHAVDSSFADATVEALCTDVYWAARLHGDILQASTGPALLHMLNAVGRHPAMGFRDMRSVPVLAQGAGRIVSGPAEPWQEEPWERPVNADTGRYHGCPLEPPPSVPAHQQAMPHIRPNAELRRLIHHDTREHGPYIALWINGTELLWSTTYDVHHPDGLLRWRIAGLLRSCMGPGRYYSIQSCAVVIWHASEVVHAEQTVNTVNADPILAPYVLGTLVEAHGPRLGQVLRRLDNADNRTAAPIQNLRGATLLTGAHYPGGAGPRYSHGLG